mgnify:CR=1 FL=1
MFKIKSLSVKNLADNLEYWIFIGIGSDLIEFKSQRLEYSHYVDKAISDGIEENDVPLCVLIRLRDELKKPFFLRPTFYRLLNLQIKKLFSRM